MMYGRGFEHLETSTMKISPTGIVLSAAFLLTGAAHAQVTLDSTRVAAKDTIALAKFYQAAFGMQEVNRIQNPGGTEVFVNFGATIEAAKANKSPLLVLFHRDSDDMKDPIPHLIFTVKDIAATVAAVKAAGGTMQSEPRPFRDSGIVIGIAIDPVGNRIELIQQRP
jgi:predicted enzyme related to lactoylglutathione lyase